MRHLGIGRADVMGLSLGARVALQVAIRHPDLVRRLVIVSAPFRRDGWYPEVRADFDQMGPVAGEMKESPLAQLYPNVDRPSLFGKIGDLARKEYDWSTDVRSIAAPTMLVFADADSVRTAHIVETFGLLGGGQHDAGLDGSHRPAARLAVLPVSTTTPSPPIRPSRPPSTRFSTCRFPAAG